MVPPSIDDVKKFMHMNTKWSMNGKMVQPALNLPKPGQPLMSVKCAVKLNDGLVPPVAAAVCKHDGVDHDSSGSAEAVEMELDSQTAGL